MHRNGYPKIQAGTFSSTLGSFLFLLDLKKSGLKTVIAAETVSFHPARAPSHGGRLNPTFPLTSPGARVV